MKCEVFDFMSENNVLLAVKSLTEKNCQGHDRIPQIIFVGGIEILKGT